jgi:hypothetical protein
LVEVYNRFRGASCRHRRSGNGGSKGLPSTDKLLSDYAALQTRRQLPSHSPQVLLYSVILFAQNNAVFNFVSSAEMFPLCPFSLLCTVPNSTDSVSDISSLCRSINILYAFLDSVVLWELDSHGSVANSCEHGNESSLTSLTGEMSRLLERLPASQELLCFMQLLDFSPVSRFAPFNPLAAVHEEYKL